MASTPKPVRKKIKKEFSKRMESFENHGRVKTPKSVAKKETKRMVIGEITGKHKKSKLKSEQIKRFF